MKGFSKRILDICRLRGDGIADITVQVFDDITVEPVPTILDTPVDLCNAEFLKAANKHATYHRNKKRIEREGRG